MISRVYIIEANIVSDEFGGGVGEGGVKLDRLAGNGYYIVILNLKIYCALIRTLAA